jgi:hypothetical protein
MCFLTGMIGARMLAGSHDIRGMINAELMMSRIFKKLPFSWHGGSD